MEIQNVAIVGMGALGMMYGEHIQSKIGKSNVRFVMDAARYQKHRDEIYTVNGTRQDFALVDGGTAASADLVVVATKYNGLSTALDGMANLVGEKTVVISVLNGISSEEIIAARYGDENLVHCVAIGMDAMRDGTDLVYTNKGKLQIGVLRDAQRPALEALARFFDAIDMPYSLEPDIRRALWGKFLLNVGINQTCMVYETTYAGALNTKEIFETMLGAMREVLAVARKENVHLTEDDIGRYLAILRTLKPDGYPSMRQDALAGRKSEVELFAGTVIRIAARHGVPVPVNEFYYKRIREMEAGF